MSILGNPVVRSEDPRLLTFGGAYAADLVVADAAHLAFVRSTVAHATISGIDTSEAKQMPGVVAVYVAADFELQIQRSSIASSSA